MTWMARGTLVMVDLFRAWNTTCACRSYALPMRLTSPRTRQVAPLTVTDGHG